MLLPRHLLLLSLVLSACASNVDASLVDPASAAPTDRPAAPDAPATTEPPPPKPGMWTKVAVPSGVDVNAIFAPRDGAAFFGTPAGLLRWDGKALATVDLGCACSVEDFDGATGFAIGMDGAQVYAGIYDGKESWAPFPWTTPRNGPKPTRVWGDNHSSFVYVPADGLKTVRYDPKALFGSKASFGREANGGDLVLYGDTTTAVWGYSVDYYWVAGRRGMYRHADNYQKTTDGDLTYVDVSGGDFGIWALRSGGTSSFIDAYASGAWSPHVEVPLADASRLYVRSKDGDAWVLGKTALVHTKAGEHKRVDFAGAALRAFAITGREAWTAGASGALYRCVLPGCDDAAAAPK